MGNRAIIKGEKSNIGVYLHWNGGADSVEAFLEYCKLREFRDFDDGYGIARFCQVVGNWFKGGLSIGICECSAQTDEDAKEYYLDNGVYVINNKWEVVKRLDASDYREGYDRLEFLISIDEAQPESERLGADVIARMKGE